METLSGTNTVGANQLKDGDIILNDDGSYNSTVWDVWVDDEDITKTWLETEDSAGFLSSYTKFLIEWDND